jgi:glycosyltransferase involved in cell wall biosynthesis
MDKVLILMATYNGQKYVSDMIESIIDQDYENWELIISDDKSTDNTVQIIKDFEIRMPEKIRVHTSNRKFGNAQKHFMYLLSNFHDAPYIMFCDQDDVWHKDKITKTYQKMQEIQTQPTIPALVHTDLRVVDENLKCINPSFMGYSTLEGERLELNHLLVQNVVTGCTLMINKALADLAVSKIPESGMLMHDWWLALLASSFGKAAFLNEATIDYRQHEDNTVGAKNTKSFAYIMQKIRDRSAAQSIKDTFTQASMLESCFGDQMEDSVRQIIHQYVHIKDENAFKRRISILSGKYLKNGFFRVLGQLLWV